MKLKKISGMLMAVVMLLISLPIGAVEVNAATILTEGEFAEKIVALQAEYPNGKYWSLSNGKITSGRYKGTAVAGNKSCTSFSNCGAFAINGTELAWQCHGFALLLSDKIFGSNRNTNTSLWQKTNYTRGSFSGQLYAGDILRLYSTEDDAGHTIFVYKVTSDRVYYADCNSNNDCGIRWTSKSISTIKADVVYVLHYQNNTLKGVPYIHIQYHANGGVTTGTDYYIQDSMIFTTKHSAVHQQNLQYGICLESGLYNDTTFKLTRDGFTFLGWTLTPDGDEIWNQDAPLYPEQLCPDLKNGDQTVVVYAKWQKNECQHSAVEQTKSATCTEAGYTVTSCTICGVELSRTEFPAIGHNYAEKVTDATCTADGSKVYTCTACAYSYTESIPAKGHNYKNNVCTSCGDVLVVDYGVEVHISDAQATAGETVTVDIVLDKNVGFTYLNLLLDYDATAMELVSVSNGTIVNSLTQGRSYIWAQADNATATGVLATLTFAVKEDASAGDYAVTAEVVECCNEQELDVTVGMTDGKITVIDFVYGDCNGDNAIDGKDVTRLLRYLANYDPVSGTSGIEISRGADVTGDGAVNGKDATRLLRYLANYDPMTGESSVELG